MDNKSGGGEVENTLLHELGGGGDGALRLQSYDGHELRAALTLNICR